MIPPALSDHDPAGASALTASIRDQAAAEVAQVIAQAQARAQRTAAAASHEAEEIQAAARRDGEASGRRQAASLLAAAEAESRRQWLSEREALIVQPLEHARAALERFTSAPEAVTVIIALIREGLRALPDGPIRVLLPATMVERLDDAARSALADGGRTLRFVAGEVAGGGVILETEDGRLRYDNSFEARMTRRIDQLRRTVAAILFAEQSEG